MAVYMMIIVFAFLISLSISISFLITLYIRLNKSAIIPTHWHILGIIHGALVNVHRLHDYVTDVLAYSSSGTFCINGPSLANMNMLFTANPLNIDHITSNNLLNYPRGRTVYDILGDGSLNLNTDEDLWDLHHRTIMSLLKLPSFQSVIKKSACKKVQSGLLPVLDYVYKQGLEIDLMEIFQRFIFDTMCTLLFDYDPQSLSIDFPYIPCEKALSEMEDVILHRYIVPTSYCKFQGALRMGHEKKLPKAWKTIDHFIYKCLAQEHKLDPSNTSNRLLEKRLKLSANLMREFNDHQNGISGDPNEFLRDTFMNLMVVGKDIRSRTLTWFFYLLAKTPLAEDKIREELHTELENGCKDLHEKGLDKFVYLHGAFCEALRLFPPIPFQHKTPLQLDILPSGHIVDHNTTIILCYYSMGRMESVWGEDCIEFKPERWVLPDGGIKHHPSYKFHPFDVWLRTCLDKDTSFLQMKLMAAAIIYHYHLELVNSHSVFPCGSILLQINRGLMVRLTKCEELQI